MVSPLAFKVFFTLEAHTSLRDVSWSSKHIANDLKGIVLAEI